MKLPPQPQINIVDDHVRIPIDTELEPGSPHSNYQESGAQIKRYSNTTNSNVGAVNNMNEDKEIRKLTSEGSVSDERRGDGCCINRE